MSTPPVVRNVLALLSDGWTAAHLAASGILGGFAVVLFAPLGTFASSRTYDLMARLWPEQVWALFFAGMAGLGFWGAVSRAREVVQMSAAALCFAHLLFALLIGWSNPGSTGTWTYSCVAILMTGRLVVAGRAS